MKKRFVACLVSLSAVFLASMASIAFTRGVVDEASASVGNYTTSASTYYNGITATSGKQLAAQLHDLITSTHRTYTTYDDNGKNKYQQNTDQYYEANGTKATGYLYEFYSGAKWPNGWYPTAGNTSGGYNREHCWCQSLSNDLWGEKGGGADMHHLRPVEVSLNSTRGNNLYGTISNRDSYKRYAKYGSNETYAHGGYYNGGVFEPLDSKKGDVARIILYIYLHYNSYSISSLFGSYGTTNGNGSSSYFASSILPLTNVIKTSANTEAKALELLLNWNTSDPVDESEQRRNEQVATYQGNRNPFIDNSSYADAIWGTSASVSISKTVASIAAGNTTTISATSSDSSTITWTSSNTSVATVSSASASSGSSITITGVAAGSATITARATVGGNNYSKTCAVTVTGSGGGGASGSVSFSRSSSTDSITTGYSMVLNNKKDGETYYQDKNSTVGLDVGFTKTSGTAIWTTSPNALILTVSIGGGTTKEVLANNVTAYFIDTDGNEIAGTERTVTTKVEVTAGKEYTISMPETDDVAGLIIHHEKETGYNVRLYSFSFSFSDEAPELSSITLDTTGAQTSFKVNSTFSSVGLVVIANYSNLTTAIVTPNSVSTPSLSSTGTKTVTVSYTEGGITKTNTYTIYVINSISASDSTVYYVGDYITKSDITLIGSLDNEITDFVFDDYQFAYSDAASGGSSTNKNFTIEYAGLSTTLTVSVARFNRVNPTDTITRSLIGVTSSQYSDWSNKSATTKALYAGNSSGANSSIQLRTSSHSGLYSTKSGGVLKTVSVSWNSNTTNGRVLDIYGKNTPYTSCDDLWNDSARGTKLGSITYGSGEATSITISGTYTYIGIRSNKDGLNLDSVSIEYDNDATNLANYIMYEDTTNQCKTKFATAKGYFEALTSAYREEFMTSDDYVISTARERLEAWARSLGKTISYSNGDYSISSSKTVNILSFNANENEMIIVIVLSLLVFSTISGYFLLRKKEDK